MPARAARALAGTRSAGVLAYAPGKGDPCDKTKLRFGSRASGWLAPTRCSPLGLAGLCAPCGATWGASAWLAPTRCSPLGLPGAPCLLRRHSGRPFGPGRPRRPRRRPGMGDFGAPEPAGRDGKTRGFRPNSPPGRANRAPGPPMSPWGKNPPRRTTGRSQARIRPGSARTGPKPADWRPGGPDAAPRSPSGENPSPRTHGGSLDHMHFSRVSGLRGIGSTAFSRVFRNARLRMPSGDPGRPPGTRAAPGRQNSRKTRHIGHAGARKAAKTRGPRKPGFSRHGKTRRIGAPGTPNPRKNTWFPDFRRANLAETLVKTRIRSDLRMLF